MGPKCPECKCEGIEHFFTTYSKEKELADYPSFKVIHCYECGHIYGVFQTGHKDKLRAATVESVKENLKP